jgi:hypothetical protein
MKTCIHCERTDISARGMCQMHYKRVMKNGSPDRPEKKEYGPCHCGKPHYSNGLCKTHYFRQYAAAQYHEFKKAKRCVNCGTKHDSDKTRCEVCLRIQAVRRRERYANSKLSI